MASDIRAPELTEDLVQKPVLNLKALRIYALGQLFLIVLLLLNVIFNWSNYCYWRLGLILGNSYLSKAEAPQFQHEYTLRDIHSDVCDTHYKEPMELACPDFCSTLASAESTGIACFVLNVLAIILNGLLSTLHFIAAHRKKMFRRGVVFLLFLPFLICLVQVIVYPLAAKMTTAKSIHSSKAQAHITKPEDFGLAGGYVVALIITVSQLVSAISSFYPHRQLYLHSRPVLSGPELAA